MSVDLNPELFTQLALDLEQQPLKGFPEHFFILDCETTGGRPVRDRMTELAWIEIKEGKIVGHHDQLFDPDIPIPPWIQKLTGISNRMVEVQPHFKQCADELYERLNQQVIMAHNARFDYGFLKNEFRRCGKSFTAKTFCSVKLSRKLYPEQKRHGLDHIINRCAIKLQSRHRAMTDVLAVLAFLRQACRDFPEQELHQISQAFLKRPSLPSHLDEAEVNQLPHEPGVYYFYDDKDNLLYVGKSVDIRTRVMSHFVQDHASATDAKLSRQIHHIDYRLTATDFGAQLLEAQEIKRLNPSYNQRLRRNSGLYQLQLHTDQNDFLKPTICAVKEIDNGLDSYGLYRSRRQAKQFLRKIAREHSLCLQNLGLESQSENACFAFQLNQCKGACCELEKAEDYNARLLSALEIKKRLDWPWTGPILVKETSESIETQCKTHLLYQWCYYGLVDSEDAMHDYLQQPLPEFDLDIYHILVRFLFNKSKTRSKLFTIQPLEKITANEQSVA